MSGEIMDQSEFIPVFLVEAKEHLENLEENLVKLENDTKNKDLLDEIFRSAHTIKGSSAFLSFNNITTLTHHIENLFDELRNGRLSVNKEYMDTILESVDVLKKLVEEVEECQEEKTDVTEYADKLDTLLKGNTGKTASTKQTKKPKRNKKPVPKKKDEKEEKEEETEVTFENLMENIDDLVAQAEANEKQEKVKKKEKTTAEQAVKKVNLERKYLIVRLGSEHYSFDLFNIIEIIHLCPMTRVPNTEEFVKGIINLRGDIVGVIDLKKRMDMGSYEDSIDARIIIISYSDIKIGLIVDEVNEVVMIPVNTIKTPDKEIGAFIEGIFKHKELLVSLIKLSEVLKK